MASFFKKIRSSSAKQREHWLFLGLAFLMFLLTLGIVVYNFSFLTAVFNEALGTVPKPTAATGFDIEGFEKLNLIK